MSKLATATAKRCNTARDWQRPLFLALLFGLCAWVEGSGVLTPRPDLSIAYLDPGSGSFMIQALVAALAGIAVTLRTYWSTIKAFFGGARAETEEDDPAVNTDDE